MATSPVSSPTSPSSPATTAMANAPTGRRSQARSNFGTAVRRFVRQKLAMVGLVIVLFLVVIGFGAPILAPYSYTYTDLMSANQKPNSEYWFGTDTIGHDFLSRVMYGTRTSLIVGFSAVGVACLIGLPLGLIAGLRGGFADFVILRIIEVMTAFPGILFAIFLLAIRGSGLGNVVLVIGITGWVTICRLLRAQILSLREQEFVMAARAMGTSEFTIAVRHVLPNALAPLIVAISLAIPTAIFAEAGLSFLGIGINEPTPSLGKMVADSAAYIQINWHLALFPTLAIALAMLGFTFVGDGLRDALDPRQNS